MAFHNFLLKPTDVSGKCSYVYIFQQAPTQQTLNHNIMFYEEPAMFHLGWISLCRYYTNSKKPN